MNPIRFMVIAALLPAALLLSACGSLPSQPDEPERVEITEETDTVRLADAEQTLLGLEEATPFPDLTPSRDIPVGESPPSEDIWGRVRAGMGMPDYRHHPSVQPHIQWHLCRPDFIQRVTARAEPLLHYILEEIEARDLPTELLLLPIVESAYLPFAYSHGRAAGIWQFIPSTGRHFGLKQNWWYDGRRDIHASTTAALDYLQQLNQRFDGDWLLALAAYNAGQGTVARAIQRNERLGRPTDFWSLDLPRETRQYVPKLLALRSLVEDPWAYHVELWPVPDEPYLELVQLDGQLDLAVAARLADLDLEEVYQLNPGFNRWATDPEGPHHLLLPRDRTPAFREGLAALDASERVVWNRHRIQEGETLIQIARQYRTTVAMLQSTNNLRGSNIRAGQYLLVPSASEPASTYTLTADQRRTQTQARGPAGRVQHQHLVQAGDTFWGLSRRYNVSVQELARWNGMAPGDTLRPGQRLSVWLSSDAGPVASAGPPQLQNPAARRQTVNYAVRPGDSLASIGQRFQVSVADIRRWNNLGNGNLIRPGQTLTLHVDVTNQGGGA
ncbi:LysM peptidoglycan-binding domain-containing protein [Thioalkalivibrio sulfidiphilus]|uniref:Lytic transglycosylase, catalytic n=1 Tax=Thioalkalivibrio sulfidiphilus (strain HL-EbGR7) TaxID=396588 RepID=B8GNV2_THISH|nr:LysM peptidoglycan-binding domain-containing protein [Thioalkalivibrio sulfidiphilus]ACL72041.1 lytic transglycosylase, catalytic [Thioalkalivibrio sulfidiphilus HL-EbGr7]